MVIICQSIKILLIFTLAIVLAGCAYNNTREQPKTSLQEQLAAVDASDGLSANEVSIIFGAYREVCYPHTAINVGDPAYNKGVWAAPVYVGDVVPVLTDESLILDPVGGSMYFSISKEVAIRHFSQIYVECKNR